MNQSSANVVPTGPTPAGPTTGTTPAPASANDPRGVLAACIAVSVWGLGPIFVRQVSSDGLTTGMWRLWMAMPLMHGFAFATRQRVTAHVWRVALVPGILFGLDVAANFSAYKLTSIANASLIPALQPLLVLVMAWPLCGERVAARTWAIATIALGGIVAIVLGGDAGGSASTKGDLLAVFVLLSWTVYFAWMQKLRSQGVPAWPLITAVMSIAALTITPIALIGRSGNLPTATDHLWILATVIGPGMAGHGLMTWAQRHLSLTTASLLTLATPAISTVLAWIVFDQTLSAIQVAGTVAVLAALAEIVRASQSRATSAAVEE